MYIVKGELTGSKVVARNAHSIVGNFFKSYQWCGIDYSDSIRKDIDYCCYSRSLGTLRVSEHQYRTIMREMVGKWIDNPVDWIKSMNFHLCGHDRDLSLKRLCKEHELEINSVAHVSSLMREVYAAL